MALTRLDFTARAAPTTGWRLTLFGASLLLLALAALNWIVQSRAHAQLGSQLAQAQPRAVRSVPLSASQQRVQEQQLLVIGDAVRQLNLPVARLVKAVRAPQDIHVALLGLDLSNKPEALAAAGTLKIAAEAETAPDMMNYVAYLGEQALFTSVYLVKHEVNPALPQKPYRFQLEAQWRD